MGEASGPPGERWGCKRTAISTSPLSGELAGRVFGSVLTDNTGNQNQNEIGCTEAICEVRRELTESRPVRSREAREFRSSGVQKKTGLAESVTSEDVSWEWAFWCSWDKGHSPGVRQGWHGARAENQPAHSFREHKIRPLWHLSTSCDSVFLIYTPLKRNMK